MSGQLTEEQTAEFREAFTLFDKDQDGSISTSELVQVMRCLGYNTTEALVLEMMSQLNKDGNGTVDFQEFLRLMSERMKEQDSQEEVLAAFKLFDKDQTGLITVTDLRVFVDELGEKLSDAEFNEMIIEADIDANGNINYEQFIKKMFVK